MKAIIMLLSVCVLLSSTSCKPHEAEEKGAETKFLVTSPLRMDTSTTKEYVCQIRAISHIEIMALERGYLQNIYVDEGQFVKAGQLLFKIMPKFYEAELLKAQAEQKAAEIELTLKS